MCKGTSGSGAGDRRAIQHRRRGRPRSCPGEDRSSPPWHAASSPSRVSSPPVFLHEQPFAEILQNIRKSAACLIRQDG